MTTIKNPQLGQIAQKQVDGKFKGPNVAKSFAVDFDSKVAKNVGWQKTTDESAVKAGRAIGLPGIDTEGSPEEAEDAITAAALVLSPGSGGGPAIPDFSTAGLINAATQNASKFEALDGFSVDRGLADIADTSPETRQRLANQKVEFDKMMSIHSDQVTQDANTEKAQNMGAAMTERFSQVGIAPQVGTTERLNNDSPNWFDDLKLYTGLINKGLDKKDDAEKWLPRALNSASKSTLPTPDVNPDADKARYQSQNRGGTPAGSGAATPTASEGGGVNIKF